MPAIASVMGRRSTRVLQLAAVAVAVAWAAGCDRSPGIARDQEVPRPPMTEAEFVDCVAALTVAVEEGRAGKEARDRAAELGAPSYSRDEIEAYADLLRADPERWAAVAARIDQRIEELRRPRSGGPADAPQAPGPGGRAVDGASSEPTKADEERGDGARPEAAGADEEPRDAGPGP